MDVRFSSLSVISRNSLPAVILGKYLWMRPYMTRRASSGSLIKRAVPKTVTLRNWRENSRATLLGKSFPNSLVSKQTLGLLSIFERIRPADDLVSRFIEPEGARVQERLAVLRRG